MQQTPGQIEELIDVIKTLEKQKHLINEIKKQPLFLSGIDGIFFLDTQEFLSIIAKWQASNIAFDFL